MGFVDEVGSTIASVAAAAGPAVVSVGRDHRGAGFVVADGQVVTSAHNLRGAAVTVTFADGRVATGEVRGVDAEGDLAVVAVDTTGAAPLRWAASEVSLGRPVLAVAPGRGGIRVTFGTVSATGVAFRGPRHRLITDGFEHTAPIGRGSSGGPVLDATGTVVGINTHRPGDGFYLAIPAGPTLEGRVEKLARAETPVRRRLGIAVAPPEVAGRLRAAVGLAPRPGLLVRGVEEGGPAARAGVRPGDLIVAVGGTAVATLDDLLSAVEAAADAPTAALGLVRGTDELTVEVSFGPWPGSAEPGTGEEPAPGE